MTKSVERHIIHPFSAVIDNESTILILGSVPSVKSVENGFYYMHPKNRFWKVLEGIFNENFVDLSKEEKTEKLKEKNIALYDSVYECDIFKSSDTSVKNIIASDIPALIAESKIKRIFCNGNLSYKELIKAYPQFLDISLRLPSTSPANAAWDLDKLISEWKIILEV